jgi:flagellar protein FlbD
MIQLTHLNEKKFWLNEDLLEFMEETPDTVLSMASGHKTVVKESAAVIQQMVVELKAKTLRLIKQEERVDEEIFT